jgi:5'-3' exonuclease
VGGLKVISDIFPIPKLLVMGIQGLTDLLKSVYAALPTELAKEIIRDIDIKELNGATIIIDFSMIAFQYGAGIRGELTAMNSGCITGFLSLLRRLRSLGNKVLVVFDQSIESTNAYDEGLQILEELQKSEVQEAKGIDFATVLQAKTDTRQKRIEERDFRAETTQTEQFHVTYGLVDIIELTCDLLDIPSFRPLVEADWLLASLAKLESQCGPTYIITEDTDLLVYDIGEAKVLRRFSLTGGPKHRGGEYQVVDQRRLWEAMQMTDPHHKAYLASILGCDYYDGVNRLGSKGIMHVLQVDPLYGRGGRLMARYCSDLLVKLASITHKDEIIKWDEYSKRFNPRQRELATKEFTKRFLSPTCFDGMTLAQVSALQMPYNVSIEHINDFLQTYYAHPVVNEEWQRLCQSVQVFLIGPLIELHKLSSRKYKYDPPSMIASRVTCASLAPQAEQQTSQAPQAEQQTSQAPQAGQQAEQPTSQAPQQEASEEQLMKQMEELDLDKLQTVEAMTGGSVDVDAESKADEKEALRTKKCDRLAKLLNAHLKEHSLHVLPQLQSFGISVLPPDSDELSAEMLRLVNE